jgi:hypothetical protein
MAVSLGVEHACARACKSKCMKLTTLLGTPSRKKTAVAEVAMGASDSDVKTGDGHCCDVFGDSALGVWGGRGGGRGGGESKRATHDAKLTSK